MTTSSNKGNVFTRGFNNWTQFLWYKSFIKQVQHIFKTYNVKILKVQKVFIKIFYNGLKL
jgi:hypothetical protein